MSEKDKPEKDILDDQPNAQANDEIGDGIVFPDLVNAMNRTQRGPSRTIRDIDIQLPTGPTLHVHQEMENDANAFGEPRKVSSKVTVEKDMDHVDDRDYDALIQLILHVL